MVSIGADVVHANRVRGQVLHQGSIEFALIRINEGVVLGELVRDS